MSGQYGIKMVDTERFEAIFEGHWPIGPHPDLGVPYISKRCGYGKAVGQALSSRGRPEKLDFNRTFQAGRVVTITK
jgi:hypothetical protein